ncbi:hypothetical protein [Breoghania sp. L-A4]|uniref:hypothetical protein n=1 Tax=Breoghania sp. L-A4 TaxID=2304600 RepID=UPI000E3595A2|nr:hypothetical protein [Breoghania sp. L-A4]AXS40347.1 hypothetical protein D1F64_10110 [Breoghania sp. L-A4]
MLDIPKTADKLRKLAADQTIVRFPDAPPPAEKHEVEPTVGVRPAAPRLRPVPRRRSIVKQSFIACVLLPTLIAGIYYAFIAADQYAVEAQFAVRSKESGVSGIEGLTFLTGLTGSSPSASDSYIVTNFIASRDLVGEIDKTLDLRAMFSRPEADWWASVDPEAAIEDLVDYWNTMVSTDFETHSGIVLLEVRAFRPEDAQALADKIISQSEKLVNDMSRRARADAVAEAENEVTHAEIRLRLARKAIAQFRGRELRLDPVATAEAREKILGELEGRLAQLQTELSTLRSVSPNSPRIASTVFQVEAVQKQINAVRNRTNIRDTENEGSLNTQLTAYEEFETEKMFAEKAFISSLASLEQARIEASGQNRYLSVFVQPKTPDIAVYPERMRWVAVVFILAFLTWAIGSLIVAGIRDHMQ